MEERESKGLKMVRSPLGKKAPLNRCPEKLAVGLRFADDSEVQTEKRLYHWVRNDETNTIEQESRKGDKLLCVRFSENRGCARCSMK